MKASQIIDRIKTTEDLTQKRFACASCGSTWIELIGQIVWHRDESENIHLQIGMESENCQICKFRYRQCRECSSRDVYEIRFSNEVAANVPLSFKSIERVARRSDAKIS